MRHGVSGRKLSRPSGQRKMLYRNLVSELLEHEKIVTTEAKAKEIRALAEEMVSLGKDNTLSSRRQALAFIPNEAVVDKLFSDIAPRFKDRSGGYTRLIKLGYRLGDGAPTAQLELVA